MAVVVVDEAEFSIMVLAAPLNRLCHIPGCVHLTVGGVAVGGADVAGGAEDFADILRQVPAVGVPGAVFADGQGARGNRLSRVPGEEPQTGVVTASEVATSELQVTAVDVALMKRDAAIRCHLFGGAASEGVVGVGTLCHECGAASVGHTGEQVPLCLVALRERHVAGQGERLQQVAAWQVGVAKLIFGSTMQEAGAIDAPVGTVAGGDGLLGTAILGIGIAGTAAHSVACFGDEVGLAARQQRICLGKHHATGGKASGGRGGNTHRILLQERKSIHHHRFGGDIRCGDSTVLRSFRAVIIDRPIRRSQAVFVDNAGQTHWSSVMQSRSYKYRLKNL